VADSSENLDQNEDGALAYVGIVVVYTLELENLHRKEAAQGFPSTC